MQGRAGFTLLEMVVAVIVVGVLAAMAFPTYQRFLERSRTAEAITLMGSAVLSQDRYYVKRDQYSPKWSYLDAAPEPIRHPNKSLYYSNADQTVFYTRGGGEEHPNGGYAVWFELDGNRNFVVARRVGSDKYSYTLVRPFAERRYYCLPDMTNEDSVNVCLDFSGVDKPEDLPADPR